MSSFITDPVTLPTKSDLTALPGGADPNEYFAAADYAAVRQALVDIRDAIIANNASIATLVASVAANGTNITSLLALPRFTGATVVTPPQVTSSQNNFTPTGFDAATAVLVLDANSGAVTITGLTGGAEGRLLVMRWKDSGSSAFALAHESASSTAANRFHLPNNASLSVNSAYLMIYSESRWRMLTRS